MPDFDGTAIGSNGTSYYGPVTRHFGCPGGRWAICPDCGQSYWQPGSSYPYGMPTIVWNYTGSSSGASAPATGPPGAYCSHG